MNAKYRRFNVQNFKVGLNMHGLSYFFQNVAGNVWVKEVSKVDIVESWD